MLAEYVKLFFCALCMVAGGRLAYLGGYCSSLPVGGLWIDFPLAVTAALFGLVNFILIVRAHA